MCLVLFWLLLVMGESCFVSGGRTERFKVTDLNEEAEASEEDEDDIDWEEG